MKNVNLSTAQRILKAWVGFIAAGSVSLLPQIASAGVWSDATRITHLYPSSTGYMFHTTYGNTTYSSCDNGRRWEIPASYDNYDAMIASLLLAFAQGKQVMLYIEELPVTCSGSVSRFYVYE